MPDPYEVLGVAAASADDATVRRRYLELTREFPPEQHPTKAAAVRAAYDALRDLDARVRQRLLDEGFDGTVDTVLELLRCQTPPRRYTLDELLKAASPRSSPPG